MLRLADRPQEALDVYEKLAAATPDDPTVPLVEMEIHLGQADTARAMGNAKAAKTAIDAATANARKAAELDPKNADTVSRLALLLQKQNKFDEANDLYRKVIEIDPKNWTAYNNLAYNLAQGGKLDEAQGVAEKALASAPAGGPVRAAILDTAGAIQMEKGDGAKAQELLAQAIANDPNNPEIRLHLAQAYVKNGDKAKAAEQLETVVKTLPEYSGIAEVRALLREIKPDSIYLKPDEAGA
jgi:Tfp pilus assembly protein PilF